jgi:hypothetical protein
VEPSSISFIFSHSENDEQTMPNDSRHPSEEIKNQAKGDQGSIDSLICGATFLEPLLRTQFQRHLFSPFVCSTLGFRVPLPQI